MSTTTTLSLTQGKSATVALGAFSSITIALGSPGSGSMTGASAAPDLKSDVVVTTLQSKTYGPYGAPMSMTVRCANGSLTYTVIAADLTAEQGAQAARGWFAQAPRASDTYVPIAIYGDSRASCGFNGTTNAYDLRAWVPSGGAPTGAVSASNWVYRGSAVQQFYPAARIVAGCGVSGDTLAQMITRETAVASATRKNLDDAWSVGARVLIFRAAINTITSSVTGAYSQATTDSIIASRHDLIQRAVSRGFLVIDEGESGYDYVGDGATYPQVRIDAIRRTCIAVNAAAREFAAASGGAVYYLDVFSLVCDSTGQWLDNMCEDTTVPGQRVHPSAKAATLYGKAEAELISSLFGACLPSYSRYGNGLSDTGNLIPNADLSASASGLGTGWAHTGNGTGPVRTAAIITRNGKRYQTITCTFTGSNASNYAEIDAPLPIESGGTITVAVGEIYGFEADFFVDDGFGGPPPSPVVTTVPLGRIRIYGAAGNLYYDAGALTSGVQGPGGGPFEGKLIWAPMTMQEASAALTASTVWQFGWGHVAGSRFRIGVASPRMVRIS